MWNNDNGLCSTRQQAMLDESEDSRIMELVTDKLDSVGLLRGRNFDQWLLLKSFPKDLEGGHPAQPQGYHADWGPLGPTDTPASARPATLLLALQADASL